MPAQAEEASLFSQHKLTSHLLINLFLEKVDQDKLVVFEKKLSRSDLQPYQVSYVHNIVDDTLVVRLCFKLHKRIPVPNYENLFANQITAETDKDGNITAIKTHISPACDEGAK